MKLYFEIAVDQQTKAHDGTFEGVPGAQLQKLDKNWLSYEQNTICPYLVIYAPNKILAHKLGKYQYFCRKPTLYER